MDNSQVFIMGCFQLKSSVYETGKLVVNCPLNVSVKKKILILSQ